MKVPGMKWRRSNGIAAGCLLIAPVLSAQIRAGSEVYADTCASGYCHGSRGAGGSGAPKLAGRGLALDYIRGIVTSGRSEMPAFGSKLPDAEFAAVIEYVASLNGTSSAGSAPLVKDTKHVVPPPAPPRFSPQAEKGRALFSEAIRAFGRCSVCHQVDGRGIAIAGPIVHVPQSAAELRSIATGKVRLFKFENESFAGLMVKSGEKETVVYDLTSPPPVERTFFAEKFQVENIGWQHAAVIQSYADSELDLILDFIREASKQASKNPAEAPASPGLH